MAKELKSEKRTKAEIILEEAKKARLAERIEDEKEVYRQLLSFSIGQGWYGVDIGHVRNTVWARTITEVPGLPHYILGVMNLRGEIISVVHLGRLLGLGGGLKDGASIIIMDHLGVTTGFYVDSLGDILQLPHSAIDPPLSTQGGIESQFIEGEAKIGELFLAIIDMDRLMTSKKMRFE